MRTLVLAVCLLSLLTVAWAGTISIAVQGATTTITTTAKEDTVLGDAKDASNLASGQTQTTNEYVKDRLLADLQGLKQQSEAGRRVKACLKFNDAATTNAQRNAILAVLGENPCP